MSKKENAIVPFTQLAVAAVSEEPEDIAEALQKAAVEDLIAHSCYGAYPASHKECAEFATELQQEYGEEWYKHFYCLKRVEEQYGFTCPHCGSILPEVPEDHVCPVCGATIPQLIINEAKGIPTETAEEEWSKAVIGTELYMLNKLVSTISGGLLQMLFAIAMQIIRSGAFTAYMYTTYDLIARNENRYADPKYIAAKYPALAESAMYKFMATALKEAPTDSPGQIPRNSAYQMIRSALLRNMLCFTFDRLDMVKDKLALGFGHAPEKADAMLRGVKSRGDLCRMLDKAKPTHWYTASQHLWKHAQLISRDVLSDSPEITAAITALMLLRAAPGFTMSNKDFKEALIMLDSELITLAATTDTMGIPDAPIEPEKKQITRSHLRRTGVSERPWLMRSSADALKKETVYDAIIAKKVTMIELTTRVKDGYPVLYLRVVSADTERSASLMAEIEAAVKAIADENDEIAMFRNGQLPQLLCM